MQIEDQRGVGVMRRLQVCKTCLLLATFPVFFAFQARSQTQRGENPQVVVSVYNEADVSAMVLAQAEREAAEIFKRAGLDVIWANCTAPTKIVGPDALVRAGEASSPGSTSTAEPGDAGLRPNGRVGAPAPTRIDLVIEGGCTQFAWPTYLALRIMPYSSHTVNEVFGVAFLSAEGTGCYSDVFYEQALKLHADWNVGLADILGGVVAHELGHLLLGSNSHGHAGIMRAHWEHEELRRLAMGNLLFTTEEAEHMRGRGIAGHRNSRRLVVNALSRF
jgi:hypothetical protein